MEEASAGMLVLAGGGDAERAVLVALVVVDSAAGSSFAVFAFCGISIVLLLLLLLLAVVAFFILLGTSKGPSEGGEVVVVWAGPSKVSNSAFGAGRFLDDRRLPYSPRSLDDHLDESVLRVNLPDDRNLPEDDRLVRLWDWCRAGIDAEVMMDFGFGDFGFGASMLKPSSSLRSSRSSLLHLRFMAGALYCRRLTLSSSISIGLGLFITILSLPSLPSLLSFMSSSTLQVIKHRQMALKKLKNRSTLQVRTSS